MNTFDHNFDREFEKTKKLAVGGVIISGIIRLAMLGFGVWVIIKVLSHFGIL